MRAFIVSVNGAMQEQGISAIDLVKKMRAIFGYDAKATRGIVEAYLKGDGLPSYKTGYMMCRALGLDERRELAYLFEDRIAMFGQEERASYNEMMKYMNDYQNSEKTRTRD